MKPIKEVSVFKVRVNNKEELLAVLSKMKKETGLTCAIKSTTSEICYPCIITISKNKKYIINLSNHEGKDIIGAKEYLEGGNKQ